MTFWRTVRYMARTATTVNANSFAGGLSASKLERIVIDASHIDQKKRGIMDMKETQVPLVQLLSRKDIKEASGGKAELLFF